jgi:hypothetical protein
MMQWGALLGKATQSYLRKDPHPDPLVRDMEPWIRIRTKMSWIRNASSPISDIPCVDIAVGALLGKAAQSYLRKDPHPVPLVRGMDPRIRMRTKISWILLLIFPMLMLQWGAVLGKAAQSYLRKLWNGACFSFDESPRGADVIMADQLAGYWYMRLGGASAPPPLRHAEKVHSALRLIFEHNVQKFAGGKLGE